MDLQGGEIQQATAVAEAAVTEAVVEGGEGGGGDESLFADDNFGAVRTDVSINNLIKSTPTTHLEESLLSEHDRIEATFDTAEEAQFLDPVEEAQKEKKAQLKKKWALLLLYFINVVLFIEVSLFIPTVNELILALLHQDADHNDSMQSLIIGAAISCYSLTQMLFTPLISWLCVKTRYRIIFFICVILTLIGNLIYAMSANIWMLIIGRLVAGIGAGNVGASFTYVRMITTAKERTKEFVNLRLAMSLGLLFGPACSVFITLFWEFILHDRLNIPKVIYWPTADGPFILSEGTVAAWISVVFLAALAIVTLVMLGEPTGGEDVKNAEKRRLRPSFLIPLFVNFVVTFIIMCFQTIITPITQNDFNWGGWQNSLFFVATSVFSIPVIVGMKFVSKVINDRQHTIIGLFLLFVGLVFDIGVTPLPIFLIGILFFMTGYTIAVTIVPGVYSSLIPPKETSVAMSYLATVAAAARIIGPFIGGGIHTLAAHIQFLKTDSELPVLIFMMVSVGLSILLISLFYKTLRPYQPNTKKIREGGPEDPGMPLRSQAEDQSDSAFYYAQE